MYAARALYPMQLLDRYIQVKGFALLIIGRRKDMGLMMDAKLETIIRALATPYGRTRVYLKFQSP